MTMVKKKVNKIDGITRAKDTKEEYWGQYDAHPDLYTNGSGDGGGGYIDDNICISDTGSGVYFGDEETTVWSSLDLSLIHI